MRWRASKTFAFGFTDAYGGQSNEIVCASVRATQHGNRVRPSPGRFSSESRGRVTSRLNGWHPVGLHVRAASLAGGAHLASAMHIHVTQDRSLRMLNVQKDFGGGLVTHNPRGLQTGGLSFNESRSVKCHKSSVISF